MLISTDLLFIGKFLWKKAVDYNEILKKHIIYETKIEWEYTFTANRLVFRGKMT